MQEVKYTTKTLRLSTSRRVRKPDGSLVREYDAHDFAVRMEIDVDALLEWLGQRAASSKGKKARYMRSHIRVSVRALDTPQSTG